MKILRKLRADTVGATAIEYGLIVGLIAIAAVTAMSGMGGEISTTFNTTSSTLAQ